MRCGVWSGEIEWKIYVVMLSGRPTWRTILMFVIARAQFTANHHKTCVYAPAAANTPLYTLDLEIGQFIRTNVGF